MAGQRQGRDEAEAYLSTPPLPAMPDYHISSLTHTCLALSETDNRNIY